MAATACIGAASGAAGGFANWWSNFQAAVGKGDAQAVARGARFPMSWENGKVREIRTGAELTGRFNLYFTAEIRQAVANGKPERLPNGQYIVTWKARGNEYSMYFDDGGKGAFRLSGLSEGPA